MAGSVIYLYRNYTYDDSTFVVNGTIQQQGMPLVDPSELSWSKEGYVFSNWNDSRDGSGTAYYVGDLCPEIGSIYAQWVVPELARITLPSGTTYNFKDQVARDLIDSLTGATTFIGVTTTALTDGSITNPITVGGESVTAETGNIVTYESKEFIWNGSMWQEFGDLSALGSLAFKNSASGSFTPSGTVSQPTFTGGSLTSTGSFTPAGSVSTPTITVTPSTTTIKNPTSVTVAKTIDTAAPGATAPANAVTYYSVSGETLSLYQIGYTTGASITTTNQTVATGISSATSTQPTFTGTEGSVSVSGTPSGTVSQPTFTGTSGSVTVS